MYMSAKKKFKTWKLFRRVIFIHSCKENSNGRLSVMNLTKFVKSFCEFGSKIKELEPTKLETDHGNGTYSLTRIYFMYILSWKMIRLNNFHFNLKITEESMHFWLVSALAMPKQQVSARAMPKAGFWPETTRFGTAHHRFRHGHCRKPGFGTAMPTTRYFSKFSRSRASFRIKFKKYII